MKNSALFFFGLLLIISSIIKVGQTWTKTGEVKVGQTWTKTYNDNPFEPIRYDTIIIFEIRGNYARVKFNKSYTSVSLDVVSCCGRELLKQK